MENNSNNDMPTLENIYVNKIRNIVGIAIHGLFENLVYLFENKYSFDDRHEIDKLIERYLEVLELSDESTNEQLDELILKCVVDRKEYKLRALNGLYGTYNLDFLTDTDELLEKSEGVFDDVNVDTFDDTVSKDYLLSVIEEELKKIESYDNFTLNSLIALNATFDKHSFEHNIKDYLSKIPVELSQTFVDNLKIRINALTNTYKEKEFKNAPLTVFDFYSSLFLAQNQMIVCLTFFEEIKTLFTENLLVKDNFFTLKKVLLENDETFLEKIVERNEENLDILIEENDSINAEIKEIDTKESADSQSNYLHKYVDFLEEILFEDIHYFMQSVENATMGINVSNEILTTLDNVSPLTAEANEIYNDFIDFLYKAQKKLTFQGKLIFNKTAVSIIASQLMYLGYLNLDGLNFNKIVGNITGGYKTLSLDEAKILTAYLFN